MSDFDFISDTALKSNINEAYDLVLELLFRSLSADYELRPRLANSLRKTVIIYIATIVEAILLWKLKQSCQEGTVALDGEWKYIDPHKILKIDGTDEEIVWCKRKHVTKKINQLDFLNINRACIKHNLLRGNKLIVDVDELRQLRNKLHIGGLSEVDRDYLPKDVDFCFSVLKRVTKMIIVTPKAVEKK